MKKKFVVALILSGVISVIILILLNSKENLNTVPTTTVPSRVEVSNGSETKQHASSDEKAIQAPAIQGEIFLNKKKVDLSELDQVQLEAVLFANTVYNVEAGLTEAKWKERISDIHKKSLSAMTNQDDIAPAYTERSLNRLVLFPEYRTTNEMYIQPMVAYFTINGTEAVHQINLALVRLEGDKVGAILGHTKKKETLNWISKKSLEHDFVLELY